jgi:integrase/recombinase XerD
MEPQIQAFLEDLASQQKLSTNTRLSYTNDLQCFSSFLRDSLRRSPQLVDFDAQHIFNFLEFERRRGRRQATIQRRRATLRRFAKFLGADFQIPELSIETDIENQLPLIEILSAAEIEQLIIVFKARKNPLGHRDHAIFDTLLETGLRISQLISIELSAVNLADQKLYLPTNNGQNFNLSLGHSAQTIAIYLQTGRPEINGAGQQSALFISQKGRRMTRQGIWQILQKWGRVAQISGQLSPRRIRNTAAKRLFEAGQPRTMIQHALGHEYPQSTELFLKRITTPPKPD